jgi:hypothetical protein
MVQSVLPGHVLQSLLAIAATAPKGAFVEFGVYQGGTAQHLAKITRARGCSLYLFDTFCGMPFSGPDDPHQVGEFRATSEVRVRRLIPDAIVVPGVFPESAKGVEFDAPIAFVHVDCDQHDSVASACRFFPPLMAKGGIMVFDDYLCLPGATRAVDEWGEEFGLTDQNKAIWRKH